MSAEIFARVIFASPLPALDREFEYTVGEALKERVAVGQRVKVSFSNQTKEGFVVALTDKPEFKGKLSEVLEIVSEVPVLDKDVYQLIRKLADRQCSAVGELLSNAVPNRSVRVEKEFVSHPSIQPKPSVAGVTVERVTPVAESKTGNPTYINRIAVIAEEYFRQDRSVIICAPDFRDVGRIESELQLILGVDAVVKMDSSQVASERYRNYLLQLSGQKRVLVGARNAMYSPISKDAALIVWDDGDQSHQDMQSPYLHTREIALVRQSLFGVPLHFLSHSRSTELQRLVNIGYAKEVSSSNGWYPNVALSEGNGLDGMSYKLIQRALQKGPVLVQVAAPGVSRSLYCAECGERSKCAKCNGPLWIKRADEISCRWCGRLNFDFKCRKCASSKLRSGAAGSTRWAEQLGKSFPGVIVRAVEASEENVPKPKSGITVSTPGIEPVAIEGYAAVVFLDCAAQLQVDSLRAPEDALRNWLNALAFMKSDGQAVAVGVSPEVSKALSLGLVIETVSEILREREELGFPPSRRFLSATGELASLEELASKLSAVKDSRFLGIATSPDKNGVVESRLVLSFTYSAANEVASVVKLFLANLKAKTSRFSVRSGKTIRPVTIKFDDPRVI